MMCTSPEKVKLHLVNYKLRQTLDNRADSSVHFMKNSCSFILGMNNRGMDW